jgi:hypothetical protein
VKKPLASEAPRGVVTTHSIKPDHLTMGRGEDFGRRPQVAALFFCNKSTMQDNRKRVAPACLIVTADERRARIGEEDDSRQ